jgi:hypothetical protein
MSEVLIGLIIVGAVVFTIVSQLKGMALTWKRAVLLPAVVCTIGFVGLAGSQNVGPVAVACIMASALIAGAIGAGQGALIHLEPRNGILWGRMPGRGLWLWAALIVSRVGVTVLAIALGAKAGYSVDSVLLALGVNRLAQAALVGARGVMVGATFAR